MIDFHTLKLTIRLKRILDRLTLDTQKVYQSYDSAFAPRWFALFMYLYEKGPRPVNEIARGLGVTHPAVTQIANELTRQGLVTAYRDTRDRRKRVLAITAQGKQAYQQNKPLWLALDQAMNDLLEETGPELEHIIENLEYHLNLWTPTKSQNVDAHRNQFVDTHQSKMWTPTNIEIKTRGKSLFDRFLEGKMNQSPGAIEILDFAPEYASAFHDLNRRWIEEFFEVEEEDERVLRHPEEAIIYPGGAIVFARDQRTSEVLGTAALINHHDGSGELVKMAVDPQAQGRKIGRMLGEAVIERAQMRGMKALYLETNSRLVPALNLYQRLGFEAVELDQNSDFERADVRMKMGLR